MLKNVCIYFALLHLFLLSTYSQPFGKISTLTETDMVFHEYSMLPNVANDSVDVFALFNVRCNKVSFIKNENRKGVVSYTAIITYTMELRDTLGVIRHSLSVIDTIITENQDSVNSESLLISKLLLCKVKYTPLSVNSTVSQNGQPIDKHKSVILQFKKYGTEELLNQPLIINEDTRSVSVNNGNIAYSGVDFSFNFISLKKSEPDTWKFILSTTLDTKEPEDNKSKIKIGLCDVYPNKSILLKSVNGITIQDVSSSTSIITVASKSSSLKPGDYILKLFQHKSADTLLYPFTVRWKLLPVSLSNPRYALESMYYILQDSEYDNMKSSSDAELQRAITLWWKVKDPTPATDFNEAMAEYFKRVDFTRVEFTTLADVDGMKTERGKIYILNGKPTSVIKKVLEGDVLQEIWRYAAPIDATYYFESPRAQQSYKLTKIVK